jgi:hypothetical protein
LPGSGGASLRLGWQDWRVPVRIADLTSRRAVLEAIAEFDSVGRDQFLATHGFRRSIVYLLEHDGRRYDSKAISAVAYARQFPERSTPTPRDFSGGEATVARTLRALGFQMHEQVRPAAAVTRQSILVAIAEYDRLGREEFLRFHQLVGAARYVIDVDGRHYDAKAIVNYAYRIEHPDDAELAAGDFDGNHATIRRPLERLGFTVSEIRHASPTDWDLAPGDRVRRVELHDRYGGTRQGGIGPSRTTPNVMLFADPDTGDQHGYTDRWVSNTEFHYTGEGQRGDQRVERGNLAILHHRDDSRSLRLFWGSKGTVEYAGEFEVDLNDPYYWDDSHETGGGPLRRVIVFRLRPVNGVAPNTADLSQRRIVQPLLTTPYRTIDPTTQSTVARDPFEIDPEVIDRGLRAHTTLQNTIAERVREHHYEPLSPGTGDPNFDLAWKDEEGTITVVEVKSLTAQNQSGQLRLGLGQLLEYQYQLAQMHEQPVRAVLAVEQPPADPHWAPLCDELEVLLVHPDNLHRLFQHAPRECRDRQIGPNDGSTNEP